jgi:hypothetical protein
MNTFSNINKGTHTQSHGFENRTFDANLSIDENPLPTTARGATWPSLTARDAIEDNIILLR